MNKGHKKAKVATALDLPLTSAVVDVKELQRIYDNLSLTGQELFDISLGAQDTPDQLKTTDEIRVEIARRRGTPAQ